MSPSPHLRRRAAALLMTAAMAWSLSATPARATNSSWHLPGGRWPTPACTTVVGPRQLLLSTDRLQTFIPGTWKMLYGARAAITTTSVPGTLLAVTMNGHVVSEDAGCTWRPITHLGIPVDQPRFFPGPYGTAYLIRGGERFERVSKFGVEVLDPPRPHQRLQAVWVQKARGNTIRVLLGDGSVHESVTGGRTWREVGQVPLGTSDSIRSADFAPTDGRKVVAIDGSDRVFSSADGGATWQGGTKTGENAFVRFSPADPDVAWLKRMKAGQQGIIVDRSTDGGRTFQVQPQIQGTAWFSEPVIVPDVKNPDAIWLVLGNGAGVTPQILRWDIRTGQHERHDTPKVEASDFAQHPDDPSIFYLTND